MKEQLDDFAAAEVEKHYKRWIDEPVPAMGGATPREAARSSSQGKKVIDLVKGIERDYYRSLDMGAPGYDPSWMWDELGLSEHGLPKSPAAHPPPLAHESMNRHVPGFGSLAKRLAADLHARPGFDDVRGVVEDPELADVLEAQRFLRRYATAVHDRTGDSTQATDEANLLGVHLCCAVNHQLHHGKTFWVSEGLTVLVAQTDADVPSDQLELPFASFALAFTDRWFLGRAERLVALDAEATATRGQRLRAATVYVTSYREGDLRWLRVTFALDALGASWPYVISRDVPVREGASLESLLDARMPGVDPAKLDPMLTSRRLRELLRVVINTILYATSAEARVEVRKPRATPRKEKDRKAVRPYSSDEVFHLGGHIDIDHVRRISALERAPGGRELLHRFMVRGHWRRANPSWQDQKLRWIEPYWKGPEMAAVIERTYRLKPGETIEE